MLFLADENFPRPLVETLRSLSHDVLWARTDCIGWTDKAILEHAELESRVILTLDKDFWQIAVQRRGRLANSGIILFRIHPSIPEKLEPVVLSVIAMDQNWIGHVSVVSAEGIQMWPSGAGVV